ncbi:hypothetical protein EDC96DRAFT_541430 [Choanephora cucurbitarum]|nr:hypothetical protein EDC96DRAFT_541430 [Choanephora cucurbitarum]
MSALSILFFQRYESLFLCPNVCSFKRDKIKYYSTLDEFVDILAKSPLLGELCIGTEIGSDSLYQVALNEIKCGHWKYLKNTNDISLTKRDHHQSDNAGIKDRLSALILNISHISHLVFEPPCFHFPLYIARQTRFNSSKKEPTSSSSRKIAVKLLNGALALCLNATNVTLKLRYLDECGDKLSAITPSLVAYLNQLDDLKIKTEPFGLNHILSHCIQLQTLYLNIPSICTYSGTKLSVTHLIVRGIIVTENFLDEVPISAPNLKNASIETTLLNIANVVMPSTSLHSLHINTRRASSADSFYIYLIQSGTESY